MCEGGGGGEVSYKCTNDWSIIFLTVRMMGSHNVFTENEEKNINP